MKGPRFDVWSRRRVNLAASGVAAALTAPAVFGNVGAKKNKKKKQKSRCRTLLQSCTPEGNSHHCCSGLNCDPIHDFEGLRCCLGRQHRCNDVDQCCGDTVCLDVSGLGGPHCCGTNLAFCRSDNDCCFDYPCSGGLCRAT